MKRITIIVPEAIFLKLKTDYNRGGKLLQQRRRSFTHKFLKEITGNKIKYNRISYVCNPMANVIQSSRQNMNMDAKERKCTFCNLQLVSSERNHLPILVYDGKPESFFLDETNRPDTWNNKTEIPVCSSCNVDLQSSLQSYINKHSIMVIDKAFFTNVEFILL